MPCMEDIEAPAGENEPPAGALQIIPPGGGFGRSKDGHDGFGMRSLEVNRVKRKTRRICILRVFDFRKSRRSIGSTDAYLRGGPLC